MKTFVRSIKTSDVSFIFVIKKEKPTVIILLFYNFNFSRGDGDSFWLNLSV